MEELEDLEQGALPEFARDPAGILRRRWAPILLALTLGLGATAIAATLLKPRFRAESTVLVTSQQIPEAFVRSTIPDDALQRFNAVLGTVLSRERLAQIIEKYSLYPDLRARFALSEIVDRMRDEITITPRPGVSTRGRSHNASLFGIAFETDHPELAAAVANELASIFITESFRMRSQKARLTADFLRSELDRAEKELSDQTHLITKFKETHHGELPDDLQANLSRLERQQQQRQSLVFEIAQAEARLASPAAQPSPSSHPRSPEARLEVLRTQLDHELAQNTEEHPNVKLLRREISSLELQSPPESTPPLSQAAYLAAQKRALEELRRQAAELSRSMTDLAGRIERIPAHQEQLAALYQRETVLRESHLELLRKVQESEISNSLESAQQGERFSILDRAEPPSEPTRARWKYLAVGFLASVLIAGIVATLYETLDPVVLQAERVQRRLGRPVLGFVPWLRA